VLEEIHEYNSFKDELKCRNKMIGIWPGQSPYYDDVATQAPPGAAPLLSSALHFWSMLALSRSLLTISLHEGKAKSEQKQLI